MLKTVNAMRMSLAAAALIASTAAALSASPEPPPGAAACSGCHPAKTGVNTPVPRLSGRAATDIVTQMQEFRSGQRPGTVMDRLAKGFSDEEVQAIAAWYAAQR
jgi:cytochrome subunit of sulfide dehydrogenase